MARKKVQEVTDTQFFDYEASQKLASFFILLDELDRKQKQRDNRGIKDKSI